MENIFWSGSKVFGLVRYLKQFLVCHKCNSTFWPSKKFWDLLKDKASVIFMLLDFLPTYESTFPNALSFMWPKQFWSVQIDLNLTIMIWSRPKWIGQVQMWFILIENHNLDLTNSFWPWPFHFGHDQIIMVKSKSIWSDQNHFGPTKAVLVT